MGCSVNPQRQPADDRRSALRQLARQPFGDGHALGRWVAGAHDGHGLSIGRTQLAAHEQYRWRVMDQTQVGRVILIIPGHHLQALIGQRGQPGF
jgi:hypothetical protein